MSADIGKGDWVECFANPDADFPLGSVWQVAEVITTLPPPLIPGCKYCGHQDDAFGLNFHGAQRHRYGWCACSFRPIYRPKSDLIEGLKRPVHIDTREPVHA